MRAPRATGADASEPSADLASAVAWIAADVASSADLLNRLDGIAGDGDLGVTVRNAAEALRVIIPVLAPLPAAQAVQRLGAELARAVPSTGGTLAAFAILAAARALNGSDPGAPATVRTAIAVEAAAASLVQRGKVAVGDKTMLDALDPAARAIADAARARIALGPALRAAARAADAGATGTSALRATVGRAGWLADRSQGHEDAGARMVALVFDAAARCIGH